MKKIWKPENLPAVTAGMGLLGLLLRKLLYTVAVDEKGLLIPYHVFELLVWIVTAAAAVLIVARVWNLTGSNRYVDNFRPSLVAGIGHVLGAAGIGLTAAVGSVDFPGLLGTLWKVCGLLCVPAMILAGFRRNQGRRPSFLCHMAVCVFLLLHLVGNYRGWSGNPQLMDYVFDLLAGAALMLFAYYETAFDVGSGRRRRHLVTGLLGAYLSFVALSGTEYALLYLGCGLWALSDLCTLRPLRRRPGAAQEQQP